MEFPCLPIVLLSGFKGTLRQYPNGQLKVLHEIFSTAQKPVTLWLMGKIFKGGEERMSNSSFANLSNVLLHGFLFRLLLMSNREAKRAATFWSVFRMEAVKIRSFYLTNLSCVTIVGAALPRHYDEKPEPFVARTWPSKNLYNKLKIHENSR
jgi:hypothetical protein